MTAPSPLRSPAVRRIVSAYTVNRLGTWFGFIALSIAVYDQTGSAVPVAALLLAGQVIPAFLVPVLVARVETSTHRGALSRLYLFEAAATAGLAAVVKWHFTLPGVLVLVALDGTAALAASALLRAAAARAAREWSYEQHATTSPPATDLPAQTYAGQAGIALATGESGLASSGLIADREGGNAREAGAQEAERRANAAINIGFAITFTLGPAIAGPTVAAFGVPTALLIDVASFLVCGAMLVDLTPHVQDAETASVRDRLRAAWEHISSASTLRRLLVVQAVALVFFEFSPPIEVAYAKSTLHAGDGGYGLLLGAWGLGAAIGSIVFARSVKRSLGLLLSASTLAVGIAYLGWAAAPSLAPACAAGLIGGIGNGMQWAALISAVQRLTPERLHAQLMGAVESIGAISPGIGFALGGAIAALASPRSALLVAGIGATASTIAFVRLPLGGLTATPAEPIPADAEPEWAPHDSSHSHDSRSSRVHISP
ncbi:MAG TPA: MFS transporter [Solirubrobacteraceae bacterium]|jgi:MFS family permease